MFSTTVIATIGRPTLARAVCSVLDQYAPGAEFEVIVVNDSGQPLQSSNWMADPRVRVLDTHRRERCVARNTGAAAAKGRYLHFLDDDDWLLPGALAALWELSRQTDAAWLYGATQLVDRADQALIQLHHGLSGNCLVQVMAGEWIPLQASLVDAGAFFRVGGFDPLIPGTEDIHLLRQIALFGDLAETKRLVAAIRMGEEGSSTNYRRAAQFRWSAREAILSQPRAFARMRASATSNAWRGRLVRTYLTSVGWNVSHRRVFAALSRTTFALCGLALGGMGLFSADFWRNTVQPYDSGTFLRGFKAANLPVARREI